jgi:7-cyano-7-deazaguanine reductase
MNEKKITLLPDAVKHGILPPVETFPCPGKGSWKDQGAIRIVFPEFTCICPKTGYPDFASIDLYYLPGKLCVELKSWKLYLNSFRTIGTFHETFACFLFDMIKKTLVPRWALLVCDFFPRGNVNTTVVFETSSPRPKSVDALLKNYAPHCRTFGDR